MDLFEAIDTRRSIREFTEEEVTDEDVLVTLKCAMQAPSARALFPWQFVIVRDKAMRQTLSKLSPYTGMAARAPVLIMVCGDLNNEKAQDYWVQDCSAATENLLLAARGKNLGTVWCGVYPSQERVDYVKKALDLPEKIIPLGMVCMGHTDEKFKYIDRFNPGCVHNGKW